MCILKSLSIKDERYAILSRISVQELTPQSVEEFDKLWTESAEQNSDNRMLILVIPPYTLLMLENNQEIMLLDTHPVSASLGGDGNGLIIRERNTESGRHNVFKWIV